MPKSWVPASSFLKSSVLASWLVGALFDHREAKKRGTMAEKRGTFFTAMAGWREIYCERKNDQKSEKGIGKARPRKVGKRSPPLLYERFGQPFDPADTLLFAWNQKGEGSRSHFSLTLHSSHFLRPFICWVVWVSPSSLSIGKCPFRCVSFRICVILSSFYNLISLL